MTTFRDIPVNETFSFPEPPLGSAVARLGLCVKISPRRYQALGRPTIYTIGTTTCDVVARGENVPVTRTAYKAARGLLG